LIIESLEQLEQEKIIKAPMPHQPDQ